MTSDEFSTKMVERRKAAEERRRKMFENFRKLRQAHNQNSEEEKK